MLKVIVCQFDLIRSCSESRIEQTSDFNLNCIFDVSKKYNVAKVIASVWCTSVFEFLRDFEFIVSCFFAARVAGSERSEPLFVAAIKPVKVFRRTIVTCLRNLVVSILSPEEISMVISLYEIQKNMVKLVFQSNAF